MREDNVGVFEPFSDVFEENGVFVWLRLGGKLEHSKGNPRPSGGSPEGKQWEEFCQICNRIGEIFCPFSQSTIRVLVEEQKGAPHHPKNQLDKCPGDSCRAKAGHKMIPFELI